MILLSGLAFELNNWLLLSLPFGIAVVLVLISFIVEYICDKKVAERKAAEEKSNEMTAQKTPSKKPAKAA